MRVFAAARRTGWLQEHRSRSFQPKLERTATARVYQLVSGDAALQWCEERLVAERQAKEDGGTVSEPNQGAGLRGSYFRRRGDARVGGGIARGQVPYPVLRPERATPGAGTEGSRAVKQDSGGLL